MSSRGSAPDALTTDPPPSRIAAVVPLVPAWRVDRRFDYLVPETMDVEIGSLVRVPFGSRRVRGIVAAITDGVPSQPLEEVAAVVVPVPLAPGALVRLLDWMAMRYAAPSGAAFRAVVPPRVRVKIEVGDPIDAGPKPLRPASWDKAGNIAAALATRHGGAWCLRPDPTAARGTVIAELVGTALRAGPGAALVGVPEVRYGSVVLDTLAAAFPGAARVDSAQPERTRASSWLALAAGHRLGAGGRATVLAPAPELALIVLDDEHHPAFKEDRAPRFDSRIVALERARLQGSVCVLVSATPALETAAAVRDGSIGLMEPERGVERAARPLVEIVDAPRERALSPQLHERIRDALRAGHKVGVLAPRRGFARSMWCASCRRPVRCPRCDAGMAFERLTARIRCPRCGNEAPAPDACPACGGVELRYLGAGSERLQGQLASSFPRARVVRADPEILAAGPTDASEADIYVTTWIGTKEVLRPKVALVAILDADALIRRPHFRSAETAYQAIAEMAAWAGPAAAGGRLVVQTAEPGHHAVQAVARADYWFFAERELGTRKELHYPPYCELIKVTASGAGAQALINQCSVVARREHARVLGPIGVTRRDDPALEMLIKCDDAEPVALGLRAVLASVPSGSRLRVDVDPR